MVCWEREECYTVVVKEKDVQIDSRRAVVERVDLLNLSTLQNEQPC
jgi:hypothetical protein